MPRLKGYRFPREIVAYAVWVYHRFVLSTADVRGLARMTRCDGQPGDRPEMGEPLWLPFFQLYQTRQAFGGRKMASGRSRHPDKRPQILALAGCGRERGCAGSSAQCQGRATIPKATDRPVRRAPGRRDGSVAQLFQTHPRACNERGSSRAQGLEQPIEGAHRPTRRREKVMGRFKSPRQAQRFLAAHDQVNTIFRPRRYRISAISYRHARADAYDHWNTYAEEMAA